MIKKITTLFLFAIIVSMIIMQPLQVANALGAGGGRSNTPPPPLLPPDSSRNQGSMACTLLIAMPYYLLDIAPDKPTKIAQWLEPIFTSASVIVSTNVNDRIIEYEPLGIFLELVSWILFAIGIAEGIGAASAAVSFGASEFVRLILVGIAYGVTSLAMTGCPPIAVNSEFKDFFATDLPTTSKISRDEIPDTILIADGNVCTQNIKVNLDAIEGGNFFNEDVDWMDLVNHPSTAYPPDYEPLETTVKWKSNFRDVSTNYDSINKIVTLPLGVNTIKYVPSQALNLSPLGTNTIKQDIIVTEIVPPTFKDFAGVDTLEPLLPVGAIVPTDLEEKILAATTFEDNCDPNPSEFETNLSQLLADNGGFLPIGTNTIQVTAKDSTGNIAKTSLANGTTSGQVFVIVEDTKPPQIFPVFDVGVEIDDSGTGLPTKISGKDLLTKGYPGPNDDPQLLPPPIFDLATFDASPSTTCSVGSTPCEAFDFTVNTTTEIVWTVSDPSGNPAPPITQNVIVKFIGANTPPQALDSTVTVAANINPPKRPTITTPIILNASDPNAGDQLEFFITKKPDFGTLSEDTLKIFQQRFSITGILDNPTDMLIKNINNHIFVSDNGSKRIIELNATGGLVNLFDTGQYSPDGFVAENPWEPDPPNVITIVDFAQELVVEYQINRDPINKDQLTVTNTINFPTGLINPQLVYKQQDPAKEKLFKSTITEGLVFIDQKDGGRTVFVGPDLSQIKDGFPQNQVSFDLGNPVTAQVITPNPLWSTISGTQWIGVGDGDQLPGDYLYTRTFDHQASDLGTAILFEYYSDDDLTSLTVNNSDFFSLGTSPSAGLPELRYSKQGNSGFGADSLKIGITNAGTTANPTGLNYKATIYPSANFYAYDWTDQSNTPQVMNWFPENFAFYATDTSTTITFSNLEVTSWGVALDDVSVFQGNDPTNLIQNGGFEEFLSTPFASGGFVTLVEGDTSIKDWKVTSGNIDYTNNLWQNAEGSKSLDLGGNNAAGAISQTIPTIPGAYYEVFFRMSANPNFEAIKTLLVTAGDPSQNIILKSDDDKKSIPNQPYDVLLTSSQFAETIGSGFTPSDTFGDNIVLMPGSYGINEQFPELTPWGAVISDWDAKQITVNTSPVFPFPAFTGTTSAQSEIYQVNITSLFVNDPSTPDLAPLVSPVAIAMDNNHYSQQKYFSNNIIPGGRDADRTDDLWNSPPGIDSRSLISGWNVRNLFGEINNNPNNDQFTIDDTSTVLQSNPDAEVLFGFNQPVTVNQFEVGLLNFHNQFKTFTRQSGSLSCGVSLPCPITPAAGTEQLQPNNDDTSNAVSRLSLFGWNDDTGKWKKLSQVEPTLPYSDFFSEAYQTDQFTIQCGKSKGGQVQDSAQCAKYGISSISGALPIIIRETTTRSYQEEVYALNFPTTTASLFKISAEPVIPGNPVWLSEINGWNDLATSGTAELFHNGPYRTVILDEVTGRLVSVELGADGPNSVKNDGGAGLSPANKFTQLFGLNFVDIKDIDVDRGGNMYVVDDKFIYKFGLNGKLIERLEFAPLFDKDTRGHQLYIDENDILHFTMQDNDLTPIVDAAFISGECSGGVCTQSLETTCPDGYVLRGDQCFISDAIRIKLDTNLEKIGTADPILVQEMGKLMYASDGTAFSQNRLVKLNSNFDIVKQLENQCVDDTPNNAKIIGLPYSSVVSFDGAKVVSSDINGAPAGITTYNTTINLPDGNWVGPITLRVSAQTPDPLTIYINGEFSQNQVRSYDGLSIGASSTITEPGLQTVEFIHTSSGDTSNPSGIAYQMDIFTSGGGPFDNGLRLNEVKSGQGNIGEEDPNTTYSTKCTIFDSAIDAQDNYYTLTQNSIWNYTSNGIPVGKVPLVDESNQNTQLDFGFRMEIDNLDNFYILDVGPSIKKFDNNGNLLTTIVDTELLRNFSFNTETSQNIAPPDPNNLRITSFFNQQNGRDLFYVSEGPPLYRIHVFETVLESSINGTGKILYTPFENYQGTDTISFKVFDLFDTSSNTATVNLTVVEDKIPPTISSSINFTQYAPSSGQTANTCLSAVSLDANEVGGFDTRNNSFIKALNSTIFAADDIDTDPTLTINYPDHLDLGTTTIAIGAADDSGNTAVCNWDLVVEDKTPPVLSIVPATAEVTGLLTLVDLGKPTADDFDTNITFDNDAPVPPEFPVGNSIVMWNGTDSSGNVGFVEQMVRVTDSTPPEFPPIQSFTVNATNGYSNAIQYVVPNATDLGGVRLTPVIADANTFATFDVGNLINFFNMFEGTNVELKSVVCNPSSGTLLPIGVTQVFCSATDNAFNTQFESFIITIHADDTDGDGIADIVDVIDNTTTDVLDGFEFNDVEFGGITSGSILSSGNQSLSIIDAATSSSGITALARLNDKGINDDQDCRDLLDGSITFYGNKDDGIDDSCYDVNGNIKSTVSELIDEDPVNGLDDDLDGLVDEDPGIVSILSSPAEINACDLATVELDQGDSVNITCGSVTVQVVSGTVDLKFTTDMAPMNATVVAPGEITFDPDTLELTAGPDNDVTIFVGGSQIDILNGTTIQLDVIPPVLTVPENFTIESKGPSGATAIFDVNATDNLDPTPAVACIPASGNVFSYVPPGPTKTMVDCTATDFLGNLAKASFAITVDDTVPPTISVFAGNTLEAKGIENFVNIGNATVSDIVDPEPTVSNNAPLDSLFPLGITDIIWTATDSSGNVATANQTITIEDTTAPTITVPLDIVAEATAINTSVTLGDATIDDIFPVSVSNNAPNGFQLGDTIVTWTATDSSGNVATANQTITIEDTTAPTITVPLDIVAEATAINTPLTLDDVTATDIFPLTITSDASSTFPIGPTQVTWTVTDTSGNSDTATQTVTIQDTTPPIITEPANISFEAVAVETPLIEADYGTATAEDIFGVSSITSDAPLVFLYGVTPIHWTSIDNNGNSFTTSTQYITITDTTSPELIVPPDSVYEATALSTPLTEINLERDGTSSATDIFGVASITSDAPLTFPLGDTIVTWTATDNHGLTTTATQTVTIQDTIPPTITDISNNLFVEATSTNGAQVIYSLPEATDNTIIVSNTCKPASTTIFSISGISTLHTVTCNVSDTAANFVQATFDVTIQDTTPPELVAPSGITVEATEINTPQLDVVLGSATATDIFEPVIVTNNTPTAFPLGNTIVTWTATDTNGNFIDKTQIVMITDTTAPIVTVPSSIMVEATGITTPVNIGTATATDIFPIASITSDAPLTFPLGDTIVTWTAVDENGNSAIVSTQTITIEDTISPSLTIPADITTEATGTTTPVNIGTATATDIADPNPEIFNNNILTEFPFGTADITWSATDASGNSVSAVQVITVQDTTPPDFDSDTLIIEIIQEATGPDGTLVEYLTPDANDIVDASPVITCVPESATIFPLGQNIVTCTATDSSGNQAQIQFPVTIRDTTPPFVTAPSSYTTEATAVLTPLIETDYGTATASDLADPNPSITSDAPVIFPLGDTIVTWTATDFTGNSEIGVQFVTITDTTPPVILAPDDVIFDAQGIITTIDIGTATATDIFPIASITSDAPLTFPLGDTIVTWTAVDENGNSADTIQTVTILTPQTIKSQIIDTLKSLKSESSEKKTPKEINKAIKGIKNSLKEKYWLDEIVLDSKKGYQVFKNEGYAVHKLLKILEKNDDRHDDDKKKDRDDDKKKKSKESPEFLAQIQAVIDRIVNVDRLLAQTAIDQAGDFAGDKKSDKEITKANKEMDKAVKELENGKPHKAIDRFEKAWKHAQKAIKKGIEEKDDE